MNVNPTPLAGSIASTSRAAAKGGTSDDQSTQNSIQQNATAKSTPAGDAPLDAGDPTSDRHGDGHQLLDTFERTGEDAVADEELSDNEPSESRRESTHTGSLDLEA